MNKLAQPHSVGVLLVVFYIEGRKIDVQCSEVLDF